MTRYRIYLFIASLLLVSILAVIMTFMPGLTQAKSGGFYRQTNLVSDLPNIAKFQDPNLVNSWGMSHSPTSPWWISDNGTGFATVYKGDGTAFQVGSPPAPLVVTIPPSTSTPNATAAPTGNVFNGTSDFVVTGSGGSGGPSRFIFAAEDGTISGWNPTADLTHAILKVDNPNTTSGPVYKGLALGHNSAGNFLYATNFRFGRVDMFDAQFNPAGSFTDSELSTDCPFTGQCFAPFGIQNINGDLYVTFALQKPDKHDDMAGPGRGFVDVFDTNGNLIRRLASGGTLNSPWGLALAPEGFGRFGKDLLVGNFGDGRINAFEPDTGAFRGQLKDQKGDPITISGLWGLGFGNDGLAGDSDTLFFTAGINDEADGLFGSITHGDH